jgi:hypothetical protein
MLKLQETTKWEGTVPNHIYYTDDSKTTMFGYVNALTGKEQWFEGKRGFDARRRSFKVLAKLADREKVVSTAKQWTVAGSKGASYTVTQDGNDWSCSCSAAQYRRGDCKHVTKIKEGAQ